MAEGEECEGYLKIAKKKDAAKKAKTYWGTLVDGTLFYYKTPKDHKPDGKLHLKKAKCEDGTGIIPFGILLSGTSEGDYCVAAFEDGEFGEWKQWLSTACGKENGAAPDKEKKKKDGGLFRAKKAIGSKAASSDAGKDQLKKRLPPEISTLLQNFYTIIEKKGGGKEKAVDVENTLIKLMLKVLFQMDRNTISMDDFNPVLFAVRDAFELLAGVIKAPQNNDKAIPATHRALKEAETGVVAILKDHVQPDNMVKFKELFTYMGSDAFLKVAWCDGGLPEAKESADILEKFSKWEDEFVDFCPVKKSLSGLLVDDGGLKIDNTSVYRTESDYLKARGVG